jgi:hypothetical protein
MVGKRHNPNVPWARRSLVLVSLLGLLALMCFPVLAQAEDSSGVVYETGPPNAEGHHSEHQPIAKSSNNSGGTPSAPGESESPAPGEVTSGGISSQEGDEAGAGNRQRHQGSPENGQGNRAKNAAPSPASPSATADSGGSSPLVPILIALAALAAISVGVVLVRQRRQRPGGGSLSTKAG